MGNDRPIKVKDWERFLKSKGCVFQSTEASHTKWKCPGCWRSIIFRASKKEIPFAHIKTNLDTLNVSKYELYAWLDSN